MKINTLLYLLAITMGSTTLFYNGKSKNAINRIENSFNRIDQKYGHYNSGEFSKDEIILSEILKDKFNKGEIKLDNINYKGNTVVLYSPDFGDIIDAYNFSERLQQEIIGIEIRHVKKKN